MTERDIDRRDMLQVLGGTATLVGLAGCLGGGDGGDGNSGDGSGGDDSSGDGGDGSSGDGGDSDDGSSDGGNEDGGSEDGGSEDSEDGGEEEPEEVPVLTGTVYEFDGETKVSQGMLTFIDNLGNQAATHDLAVSAEFRVTDLEINGEYELQITQMESYPDQTVEFVAEPPEGYGESEGEDGGNNEEQEGEEEDPDVPLTMAVDDPETSIVDPETNSITMETGVTGTESYAWDGRLEFQTDQIAGEWTHEGERSANRNAVVTDENLARTQTREKESLTRVFVFEENEEGERVLSITLVNPIETGTNCREEDDIGGYPDWVAHQAVQHGLEPFDSFTYNGKVTFDEHPAKLGGIRTKEYEVDPEGTPLTFTLYASDETGEVVRIDGAFDISEIDRRIFESQLLSTRGTIDFFEHGEDRFVGVNAC